MTRNFVVLEGEIKTTKRGTNRRRSIKQKAGNLQDRMPWRNQFKPGTTAFERFYFKVERTKNRKKTAQEKVFTRLSSKRA